MPLTNQIPHIMADDEVNLTDDVIREFRLSKVFNNNDGHPLTSLEFDDTGEFCLVGCPGDESISLYSCLDGELRKSIFSKKYGVGPVRFTHHPSNVIYASNSNTTANIGGSSSRGEPRDEALRYLSLHDNAYLRYYRGHEGCVTGLVMSPRDDMFISAALNDTVRVWDLRSPHCQGVLAISGAPLLSIDPAGLIFALVLDNRFIRLFDLKNYERGPFACFEIIDNNLPTRPEWCSIDFSPDGKELLVGTKTGSLYLIDSFDGIVKQTFSVNPSSSKNLEIHPSFAPDNRYILCGGPDGGIRVWGKERGRSITVLEGHPSLPTLTKFNPRLAVLASAASNLAFWQPSPYQ